MTGIPEHTMLKTWWDGPLSSPVPTDKGGSLPYPTLQLEVLAWQPKKTKHELQRRMRHVEKIIKPADQLSFAAVPADQLVPERVEPKRRKDDGEMESQAEADERYRMTLV